MTVTSWIFQCVLNQSVIIADAETPEITTGVADGIRNRLDVFRNRLGPHLKSIQQPIDEWLGQLPMSVAMVCCIGLFAVALLWVWTLKRDFIFRGAPGAERWRDLRIWATLVVIPYILVYLWWGR